MKKIFFIALMMSATTLWSQKTEANFWVAGLCGMCEKTIENALDKPGVVFADYDLKTHRVRVVYKSKKISEEQLHRWLNEAGYDTEKSKATQEQYSRVHDCCRYRELQEH